MGHDPFAYPGEGDRLRQRVTSVEAEVRQLKQALAVLQVKAVEVEGVKSMQRFATEALGSMKFVNATPGTMGAFERVKHLLELIAEGP